MPEMGEESVADLSNFFPLTAYKSKLGLAESYRVELLKEITKDYKKENIDHKKNETAWTGDVSGFEFLHVRKSFENLFKEISNQVETYRETLKVADNVFDFYYTRSWATVTTNQQDIQFHKHLQSHITAVYYLKVPKDSGDIILEPFLGYNQNEFIPGLLQKKSFTDGTLEPSLYLSPGAGINVETDDILIFPSKTSHGTVKSKAQESRISISADIVAVLKDSNSKEYFLPPLDMWRKF